MKLLDWKFVLTLAATLAGVIVPIWIWRADIESRSLRFVLLSQTSLQPTIGAGISNLKVTLDGVELPSPTLTVMRLSNDGTRPIPASDFEGPLRLVVAAPAKLVRANVTELSPSDLSPSLSNDSNSIAIAPMLLNPGDSITLAIFTSGTPKTLESKARIAGLKTVPVDEKPSDPLRPLAIAIAIATAVACMIGGAFFVSALPSKGTYLRPRAAILVTLICGTSGMLIVDMLFKKWDWQFFATAFVLVLVAQPLSKFLNRPLDDKEKTATQPINPPDAAR